MAEKVFVLDTNVLVHDPEAFLKFPNNRVVIPMTALEELDKLKRQPGEVGKNARHAIRELDALRSPTSGGDLHVGVPIPNNSSVCIQIGIKTDYNSNFALSVADNRIIMAAYLLQEEGQSVTFVSKDFAARVKAEAVGLQASDYEYQKYAYDTMYAGMRKVEMPKHQIDLFYKDGGIPFEAPDLKPNEYCILTSIEHSSAVAKHNASKGILEPLLKNQNIWGIQPRNVEQRCAIDLLLRDDIRLVTLLGPAGTGKTLLALACGMRKVFDEGTYTRMLVSRPIMPLGRDIGYLPGTKEEKLTPWMQPIYDNLEFLCDASGHEPNETLRWVMDSRKIEMEAVTYIRGRSLPKAYIIVDEAQNLTPHEVKTIVSRAGEGTKVILTGDATQIDHPYLDKDSNGLTFTVGKMADQAIYGHIFLNRTERSELAALAAAIL